MTFSERQTQLLYPLECNPTFEKKLSPLETRLIEPVSKATQVIEEFENKEKENRTG